MAETLQVFGQLRPKGFIGVMENLQERDNQDFRGKRPTPDASAIVRESSFSGRWI